MFSQITKFLFGSVTAQGMSSIAGLLFAHWMTVEEYALFTIMMMITGAMNILTKGGVHLGFTAIIGRTWPDRTRAKQVTKAAIIERKFISIFVLPPILVTAGWLLWKNHADYTVIGSLLTLLIINWQFDMQTRIIDQILMFANKAARTQVLDTILALFRLIGTTSLYYLHCLNALGAVALGVIVAGLRIPFIQRWVRQELVEEPVDISPDDRKEIKKITRRQLPIEIFYVLQSQIVLVILAWYSATEQTASIGALWRIGQLLLPVQAVMHAFAIPHFSRVKSSILRTWFLWSFACSLPGLSLVLICYFFPDLLLLLIGPNYANLQYELFIAAIGTAVNSAVSISLQLIAHRGWNHYAWIQIPVVLVWCATAPFFLNLRDLDQVLWFNTGLTSGTFCAIFFEIIAAKYRGDLKNKQREKHISRGSG
ncbi:MAG: hypothetical protein CTY18_04145 [Methylomonas sp.]|nr:hypothetical protein [Flavobacterium sp.]PPD36568.1 MAG: hypothetical protein CTY18_04145 [Methylomonas sp.]